MVCLYSKQWKGVVKQKIVLSVGGYGLEPENGKYVCYIPFRGMNYIVYVKI